MRVVFEEEKGVLEQMESAVTVGISQTVLGAHAPAVLYDTNMTVPP
jgi:hypothetical protein